MLTTKQHILGLKGAKIYMQNTLREINFEGMGEKDEREAGETFDAAIEALEKQIPVKPIINLWDDWCECPKCSGIVTFEGTKYDYCPDCGQKIDWS